MSIREHTFMEGKDFKMTHSKPPMNTEFEKVVKEQVAKLDGVCMLADTHGMPYTGGEIITPILKAHNQHLRTVLEGLKAQQRDYHTVSTPGNVMPAVRVKHIEAEIAKLGGGE